MMDLICCILMDIQKLTMYKGNVFAYCIFVQIQWANSRPDMQLKSILFLTTPTTNMSDHLLSQISALNWLYFRSMSWLVSITFKIFKDRNCAYMYMTIYMRDFFSI